MEEVQFRKLSIDLPRQPVYDQRPWLWAGIAFAVSILLLIAGAYIQHRKQMDYGTKEQMPGQHINTY